LSAFSALIAPVDRVRRPCASLDRDRPDFPPSGRTTGVDWGNFPAPTLGSGFDNVGIAAAARTGHNAEWHDIASGSTSRAFRQGMKSPSCHELPFMSDPVTNDRS
jgi:hypothetical protein